MCLYIAYQKAPPLPRNGACAVLYDTAKQLGWVTESPVRGDVFFRVELATGHAHHTGFVVSADPLVGLSGNTSEDGLSSNGVGVFEHPMTRSPSLVFVHIPESL